MQILPRFSSGFGFRLSLHLKVTSGRSVRECVSSVTGWVGDKQGNSIAVLNDVGAGAVLFVATAETWRVWG